MAGYAVKACTNKAFRKRSSIAITAVLLLSVAGTVLCIYNFINAKYLFALSYFFAIILGFTYVFIKYTSVFATYAATDRQSVYMRNWTNGFFPFRADSRIRLLSEFMPAKTLLTDVHINDIASVTIGTKNFIKRHCSPGRAFLNKTEEIEERLPRSRQKTMSSMDLLYIETKSGDCRFMPIVNFSKRNVIKIIQTVQVKNPDVQVKLNSRAYRNYMAKAAARTGK